MKIDSGLNGYQYPSRTVEIERAVQNRVIALLRTKLGYGYWGNLKDQDNGNINAAVEGLSARSPLYRPGRVEWTATGPLILDAPAKNIGLTASWLAAESKVDFGLGGLSGVTVMVSE